MTDTAAFIMCLSGLAVFAVSGLVNESDRPRLPKIMDAVGLLLIFGGVVFLARGVW